MEDLKIAICDDDQYMLEKVHKYLKAYFFKQHLSITCSFFTDGMYLLESEETYDIILLDIEMKIINGIKVKEKICMQRLNTKIIFLTSYKDMAIEAVGRNVYGFVPKDEMERLEKHLNAIIHEYKTHQLITITGENIDVFNIVYIHSSAGYCHFYDTEGNERVFRILLNQVEELLSQNKFFIRIHQSYIINFNFTSKCTYKEAELKKGKNISLCLPISRKYTNDVAKKYTHYRKERCRYG